MGESLTVNWWHLGIGLGALAVLALVADWLKSRVIAKALERVASEAQVSLDQSPFDRTVLRRLAPIVPSLVVYYGIVPALGASVQITTNDIIRIGDWVEVPHASTDGTVIDIDLHTASLAIPSGTGAESRSCRPSISEPSRNVREATSRAGNPWLSRDRMTTYLTSGATRFTTTVGTSSSSAST